MKYTFPYVQAGIIYRPIIPVTLRFKNIEVNYLALLDSGADFNIFHADIAAILKIDLKKQKRSMPFGGIHQGAKDKGYVVSLQVGIKNQFHTAPVLFSPDISENGYGILGQQGFFNNFAVCFNYPLKTIDVYSQGE